MRRLTGRGGRKLQQIVRRAAPVPGTDQELLRGLDELRDEVPGVPGAGSDDDLTGSGSIRAGLNIVTADNLVEVPWAKPPVSPSAAMCRLAGRLFAWRRSRSRRSRTLTHRGLVFGAARRGGAGFRRFGHRRGGRPRGWVQAVMRCARGATVRAIRPVAPPWYDPVGSVPAPGSSDSVGWCRREWPGRAGSRAVGFANAATAARTDSALPPWS